MSQDLIFDCSFGAGANMLIGALLGITEHPYDTYALLTSALDQDLISQEGYRLIFEQRQTDGVHAYYFDCQPMSEQPYEHRHEANHSHNNHSLYTSHTLSQHNHGRRTPSDLHQLIERTRSIHPKQLSQEMVDWACQHAHHIVDLLTTAESKVHGIEPALVHFHELGAIDCYVDILLFSLCLAYLKNPQIYLRALNEGIGVHTCAHGQMSLPGLAVTKLLEGSNVSLGTIDEPGEHLTPTAVACLVGANAQMLGNASLTIGQNSTSCGNRTFAHPNICRLMQGTLCAQSSQPSHLAIPVRQLQLIETNIDDSSGQTLAYCIDRLIEAGVCDAWIEPIIMKKGRPAHKLCVLAYHTQLNQAISLIMSHTTSIGLRVCEVDRYELERSMVTVEVQGRPYQAKQVKIPHLNGNDEYRIYPEHEEIKRLMTTASCGYERARTYMEQACQTAEQQRS